MKTLKEAKIGETVHVTALKGEGAIKRRIMDMVCHRLPVSFRLLGCICS